MPQGIVRQLRLGEHPAPRPAAARHASVSMDSPQHPWLPSPAPWVFEERIYGIAHCLIDRDGRVIGSHLPLPNGPLMAEAPVMADLLRHLVAGESINALKVQARAVLRRIDRGRPREPGEDDD